MQYKLAILIIYKSSIFCVIVKNWIYYRKKTIMYHLSKFICEMIKCRGNGMMYGVNGFLIMRFTGDSVIFITNWCVYKKPPIYQYPHNMGTYKGMQLRVGLVSPMWEFYNASRWYISICWNLLWSSHLPTYCLFCEYH